MPDDIVRQVRIFSTNTRAWCTLFTGDRYIGHPFSGSGRVPELVSTRQILCTSFFSRSLAWSAAQLLDGKEIINESLGELMSHRTLRLEYSTLKSYVISMRRFGLELYTWRTREIDIVISNDERESRDNWSCITSYVSTMLEYAYVHGRSISINFAGRKL